MGNSLPLHRQPREPRPFLTSQPCVVSSRFLQQVLRGSLLEEALVWKGLGAWGWVVRRGGEDPAMSLVLKHEARARQERKWAHYK